MAPKLFLAALVSLAAVYCTSAAPFSASTVTATATTSPRPSVLDAIVRFRRSATSPEESVLVTLKSTNEGGFKVSIAECPAGMEGCDTSQPSVRRKRTINMSMLLNILRAVLKLFGIRIPDPIFDLFNNALGGGSTQRTSSSTGSTSSSSSGALNLEALLG